MFHHPPLFRICYNVGGTHAIAQQINGLGETLMQFVTAAVLWNHHIDILLYINLTGVTTPNLKPDFFS